MGNIKILTQNVFGPFVYKIYSRLNVMKETIESHSCDLVSLQEVIFYSYLRNLNKNYYRIYENGRLGPKGGLVILSKVKPDGVEFHKFREQGSWFSGQVTDRIIEKGFLVAKFGDITFVDTHLVHTYGKMDRHKNHKHLKRQFNQLLYFLKNEKRKGQKIILAGDLNFSEDFTCYKELASFLRDHTYEIKDELKLKDRRGHIDYVWGSFSFGEKKVSKVDYPEFVSDHPGVLVEMEIGKVLKPVPLY